MINFDELKTYNDYAKLKGPDIIQFMKTKPREDIEEFKKYCAEPKYTVKIDGTKTERKTNFFEIRNWVLDKYYPGLRDSKTAKTKTHQLLDEIMEL